MSEEGEGVMSNEEFRETADEMDEEAKKAGFEEANSFPPPLPDDQDMAA